DKVQFNYAESVSVEYFNHYKVVTITQPWPGAEEAFSYVLVQCGTPTPEDYDNALIIEVPVKRVISMSTTYLPHIVRLGVLDTLIGVDTAAFASTPEVVELAEAGELIEVGSGSAVNVELVLEAEPDLVLTYGSGFADYDAHPVLLEAGIPTALNADFTETTPLGRAEWLKYTALFYNQEAAANELFDSIAQNYEELAAQLANLPDEERPTVLTNTIFGDAWNATGAQSYAGRFIYDAGARLVLEDVEGVAESNSTVPLDPEVVFFEGADADFWLVNAFGVFSLEDLLSQDERYADFLAVSNGGVYSNIGRIGPNGGYDYYETGVIEPDVILKDLIAIFHPELFPDHELVYYRQLQ
ncbi:MAG: ABC transporter substrate-binding protein, partial [Phototrophicales bacterium]